MKRTKRFQEGGTDDESPESAEGYSYTGEKYDESKTPTGDTYPNAPSAPAKPKTVTKEQLAASGYDNLRDYLNAQQGLKRKESPKSITVEKTTVTKPEPSFEDRVNAAKEKIGVPVSYANRIPKDTAPKGLPYNPDTSTEVGRNIKNTMSALTPLGGGVGKIAAELALAGRGAKTASKVAEVAEKGREAVTNPMAWAGGPKAMKAIQTAENVARKAAPKAASIKKVISEADTTGGAIGYKKGGNISKRADGIAIKGHTRCKVC
jgi:hypothetical protein